jgi:hypothetical protein
MLSSASNLMSQKCELKFRNDQFNRVALPLLEATQLIVKIDPRQQVPAEILQWEHKLIRKQMDVPIWLFDIKFYRDRLDPEQIRGFLARSLRQLEAAMSMEVNASAH